MVAETEKKLVVLDSEKIRQITERMAYQILENNYDEKELIFVGIRPNGYLFAEKLIDYLKTLTKIKITLTTIELNKDNPLNDPIRSEWEGLKLDGKVLILVDDVANTGKTLFYALKPIMNYTPKKIQIAVLINREHKMFAISADYVGLSLSTTLQEHITVDLKMAQKETAYLS